MPSSPEPGAGARNARTRSAGTRSAGTRSAGARPGSPPRAEAMVWALLLATSAVYFFWTNEADNDLWGHLLFGRDILTTHLIPRTDAYAYTTAGHPWVDHEWLSQLLMAAVYGWTSSAGLVILKFAVAIATLLLVLERMRREAPPPYAWGVVGLLSVAVLSRGFAIRPQTVTYLLVAFLLLLLSDYTRGRRRVLWVLPGVFLLWANLHGGFVLGLAILGLFAAATLLDADGPSPWPWLVLTACALVTALNPYGPGLLLYIWNELSRAHPITEWQPAALSQIEHFAFFAMLALFVATLVFFRDWRRRGWEVLLALGMGAMAVRQQRHTPVFALCAAAPLTAQLTEAGRWLTEKTAWGLSGISRRIIAAAIVVVALVQLVMTGQRLRYLGLQIVFDPADYPVAAVRALVAAGAHGNLAVPLDWGEYVLWFLAPQVKVSLDGRFATVFSERVVVDNFAFYLGAPEWRRLIDAYPTQAALVPAGWPCPIGTLPDWQLAYRDRWAEVYVKQTGAESFGLKSLPIPPPARAAAGIFP